MLTVEPQLWRATSDNRLLEDVSAGVVGASVSCDPGRDATWALDATVTADLWESLTPFLDWVAPVLVVTWPDGTVRRDQLGLYMVLDSPETHGETGATVRLEAGDHVWFLSTQGFVGDLSARAGSRRTRLAEQLLKTALLNPRFAIPDDGGNEKGLKRDREWERGISRLDLCNQLLRSGGYYPLWATKTGVLTTRKRGERRLRHRTPVKSWTANVPAGFDAFPFAAPPAGLGSEVVGTIDTTPDSADLVNEIVVVSDDTGGRIRSNARIRNRNGANPRAVYSGQNRTRVRKINHPLLDDDDTAQQIANAYADELSTTNSTIRMTVLPDPVPDYVRANVLVGVWDAAGRPVAVGQYAVHRVEYGLTAGDALMTVDLGRIDDADDVLGG